jgi:hypothetical protein
LEFVCSNIPKRWEGYISAIAFCKGNSNCISDLEVSDIQSVLVVVVEDVLMCAKVLCAERCIEWQRRNCMSLSKLVTEES